MSQKSKTPKVIVGYGQLQTLRFLSSRELTYQDLVRQLLGGGGYKSTQTATDGIDVLIKAQIIEKRENSDLVRLSPMGKKFLEGLEGLFRQAES